MLQGECPPSDHSSKELQRPKASYSAGYFETLRPMCNGKARPAPTRFLDRLSIIDAPCHEGHRIPILARASIHSWQVFAVLETLRRVAAPGHRRRPRSRDCVPTLRIGFVRVGIAWQPESSRIIIRSEERRVGKE